MKNEDPFIDFAGTTPTSLAGRNVKGTMPNQLQVKDGDAISNCLVIFYNTGGGTKDEFAIGYNSQSGKPDVILYTSNGQAIPKSYDYCKIEGEVEGKSLRLYF